MIKNPKNNETKSYVRNHRKIYEDCVNGMISAGYRECYVVRFGKAQKRLDWDYALRNNIVQVSMRRKTYEQLLIADSHLATFREKMKKTYNLLRNITVAFTYTADELTRKSNQFLHQTKIRICSSS